MSRILHNRVRSSLRKSWPVVDKRAVAFSMWSGRRILLYKPVDTTQVQKRRYGMLVARAVRGLLKLRYIVLGGAVGGGMTLNKKYSEWKDGLPDMGWVNDLLPNPDQWSKIGDTLIEARERIGESFQIAAAPEPAPQLVSLASRPPAAPAGAAAAKDDAASYEGRIKHLQEEMLAVQARYQRELRRLEGENLALRQQNLLLRQGRQAPRRAAQKSLIDMYSGVLDAAGAAAESLPRVVVVGDQSAGKTSVLEMIARARVFPRGAGEMCTRAPVKVTLSEGPYHVAQFNDSQREFDLTKESELAELRREVELRMRDSVRGGRTVSSQTISMSVRGPGLPRMVLVDLPGVISTQTVDMAADTREAIQEMSKKYMENPNAIILCIQDGSVDAERSNVTELVARSDPHGRRTIFVLTKVDLAEQNLANPDRIRRILEGKLFPMRALGYYAVVTGRSSKTADTIQTIRDYEDQYFKNSRLFKDGVISPSQVTTRNLELAVADCFWKMVRASVEQQADSFKALRFNLETEWKNSFPRTRELDRDELFERARAALLDRSAALQGAAPAAWEARLAAALWARARQPVIEGVYLPSAKSQSSDKFNTMVDIKLREWAQSELPALSVQAGLEALGAEFKALMDAGAEEDDAIFDGVKHAAVEEALGRHEWEDRALDVLRVLQLNALQDACVTSRQHWDGAADLMARSLGEELDEVKARLADITGPSLTQRWLYWRASSDEQDRRREVKTELDKLGSARPNLSYDEVVSVRDTLRRRGVEVDNDYIRDTWEPVYLKNFLEQALTRVRDCRKSFYLYSQQSGAGGECSEIVMFWRVQQALRLTASALRQQIHNRECARLDRELRDVLDEMSADPELKKKLLSGRRVELAEELKRVRDIQEKLEEFIKALNKEKLDK